MRKPTNSAMETVSRMRWPRPVAGWHCAQSGIRGVVNLLGKVPNQQSVERLECWMWDQVYTKSAISVLSLATCMVMDVVFPVNGSRCHQNCWAGALVANLLAALGVARLLVASRYAHPPRWACRVLRMLPPRWLHEVSDSSSGLVSRMKEACSARFPANGFGTSIVYVLAGHSGVYVGKARLDRKKMCGMGPRALEHVRALLYTNVRDGMKPRYRILRRSLGSVFMLPAIWCESEVKALATEAVLIKLESPLCNVVDGCGSIHGKRCKVKGRRKRPSSWLRRSKSPFASIWNHQSVVRQCTPVSGPSWESRFPGALGLALPFKQLYTLQIRETFAKEGVLGPINLFEWRRVGLLIMYLCCHRPFLCSPPWFRDSLARFWYFVADRIDDFVVKPSQRAVVRKNIGYFLKKLQLPGLFVPLFLVPGELKLMRQKGWVLSSVKMALQAMRCKPARAWIVRHLRLCFGKRGVWSDLINAKKICRDAVVQVDRSELEDSGVPAPKGLNRLPGAWRLPVWPVVDKLVKKLCKVWDRWSICLGASDQVRFKGRNGLQSGLLRSCFPDAPSEWFALQSPMDLVAPDLRGKAVIGDDKDHSKIWVADQGDLCRYVAECVEMDKSWAKRDDLRPRDVSVWLWARAFWGLPAWLRRGKLATSGNVKFPTVFPLVKGKCFSVTGSRKCEKVGHSCMRRVVDCAGAPGAQGNKIIGRAGRAFLDRSGISAEVFNISRVRARIQHAMDGLSAPATCSCQRCGCATGSVSIVTLDADQAFEACSASAVLQAWDAVEHVIQERIGSRVVLVKRGKKEVTSLSSDFKSGWWSISLDVVRQAIRAFSWVSLVCVAGSVYELKGLPIGGVLSGLCLSVVLGKQEYEWHANRIDQIKAGFDFGSFRVNQCVAVLRYVDDILLISLRYCRQCLVEFAKKSYSIPISVASDVTCDLSPSLVAAQWLDLDLYAVGWNVCVAPKNLNRKWLYQSVDPNHGVSVLREKCTLLEWPGRPPLGFALLVSGAKMRIARARSLGLSEVMSAIWVLEYLLELFLIGYPCSCLRAIAHDLPWSAVACQVRWVIRTWIVMAGSKDFSNMKNVRRKRRSVSPKPGLRGRPMEDKRVKMRRSWRRRERSSPSSTSSDSSSSGAKIEKRVKKAQKVLERRDPAYRAWRDEERTREREKDLRRQGEALAAAMASRWDEALRRCAMVPAGAPHVQSAPVGVSGAFQSFPPVPPPGAHFMEDEVAAPIAVGKKLTRSQVGWLDLLFKGMVSIPVDCTPEEACRMISARTDDRGFVALLNEAMAVVLPGEPIPRAKADRVRMLVDAVQHG